MDNLTSKPKTLKIPSLKIEIEMEVREQVKWKIIKKDIKIPKGWRLMKFAEGCYCFDNHPELKIGRVTEWIEHYSKKMEDNGCLASLYDVCDGDRLGLVGDYFDDGGDGFAFGVRFVRDLK